MTATIVQQPTDSAGAVLDVETIRQDFPILNQPVPEGRSPLAFLDSAASSQKPSTVIEALDDYYRTSNANIHRGVYHLSEIATARYEEARRLIAEFINAKSPRECIFVRNTTEAINLVAYSWGRENLQPADTILLTVMEHHSNLVPWQMLAEEKGLKLAFVPMTDDQQLDMEAFERLVAEQPKLVAVGHVSNAIGTVADVEYITRRAHEFGATVLIDAAQSVPHLPVDVQKINADFLALSGHKMLGPMGSGVLYGKRSLLEKMTPFMGGGSMIRKVTLEGTTYADLPTKFEAGTPGVANQIGLGTAVEYLTAVGMQNVRAHELELLEYALDHLSEISGLVAYGPENLSQRSGVISFTLGDIHPHDVAAILDDDNVAVRAGHHCAQPMMHELGVVATTRASFHLYNTKADVDQLVTGLHRVNSVFSQ